MKGYTLEELNQFEDAGEPTGGYTLEELQGLPDATPEETQPKMGGFLESLVKTTQPKPEPVNFKGIYDTTKNVVSSLPEIGENVLDTVTTKQGLSDLWKVTKGAGVPGVKNVISNFNELFWGGAQKGLEKIGADMFAGFAGEDKARSNASAKKSSDEIKTFFYGDETTTGYSDPNDTRTFLEKISSEDGEKEVAKVIGSQLPTFAALLGVTFLAKGANIPSIPATYATSLAMGAGDSYQQGKDYYESTGAPMTPEQEAQLQKVALMVGATAGVLDTYGISRVMKPSQFVNFKNLFVKEATNAVLDVGVDTVVEGGTEALQEILQNAYAQTYNKNQNLFEGVPEAMFGGGVFGGGSSAIINSAGLLRTGVLERIKAGKTPEEIKEEVKIGAQEAGSTLSDAQIDEAINDAQMVYNGIAEDIVAKLDSGKSVNEVALEVAQSAPLEEAVSFVQQVAENRTQIAPQSSEKAISELNAIADSVDEKVLTKTAKDLQDDFERTQAYIDEQVKDLTEKVSDLKERVDKAENRSTEKKRLKAQLENARAELRDAQGSFIEKVQKNAKAFRAFVLDYATKQGAQNPETVADNVVNMVTDEANIESGQTVEELIMAEVGEVKQVPTKSRSKTTLTKKEVAGDKTYNNPTLEKMNKSAKDYIEYYNETHAEPSIQGLEYFIASNPTKFTKKELMAEFRKKPTQKEKVKKAVEKKGKASIKEIASETGILEPNVRRILGVGAKEGEFERVGEGVYTIKTPDGKEVAVVIPADAVETLPKLAKEGFKADMVFLDIPYDTPAVKGGNRGVKYNLISVEDFSKILEATKTILRDENAPVIHMFSQATSGLKAMQKYNDLFTEKGFVPIGKGDYQKTTADGSPVKNMRGEVMKPEGIIVFNQSGNFKNTLDLQFKMVRPKGYQTEKPAEMLAKMIEMTTEEGDIVLDPFAGSGVTGAEAVKKGRKAVLIEKDKDVAEKVTKKRVETAVSSTKKNEAKELALEEIKFYIEASEAGKRVFVPQKDSMDYQIKAIPSTFPQFVPENMRARKTFDRLKPFWDKQERPSSKTPMLQALYDIFTNEVEKRTVEIQKEMDERKRLNVEDTVPFKTTSRDNGTDFVLQKYKSNVEYGVKQATEYLENLKKRLAIDFDTVWVDAIVADYSVDPIRKTKFPISIAEGLMADNTIALKKELEAYTAQHESIHLTIMNLDRIEAFRSKGITRDKLMRAMADKIGVVWNEKNDLKIEEQLAYDFEYYLDKGKLPERKGEQKYDKNIIVQFFETLKKLIDQFFNALVKTNGSLIKDYYDVLAEGYSVASEVTRLENEGVVKSFLKDGVLDAYALGSILKAKSVERLTTKILKDLEGKVTVSKQYILDATNRGELKQVERDLIRKLVQDEPNTVDVTKFANKVKAELLPLERKNTRDIFKTQLGRPGGRYEQVTLPENIRGNVANYEEVIYESPIKTSAGSVHFSGAYRRGEDPQNYFGHTRIEDMADNQTRRVIEVQSDLYQKGGLEREQSMLKTDWGGKRYEIEKEIKNLEEDLASTSLNSVARKAYKERLISYKKDLEKLSPAVNALKPLQQYNDPTAHFRMIREEIATASEDGKTKLQFPTGETAMKIEGLGQTGKWGEVVENGRGGYEWKKIETDDLKIGKEVNFDDSEDWIITDVLGDGKFKAVQRSNLNKWKEAGLKSEQEALDNVAESSKETFDISGKVDTNNPIYKFYEKEVGRYLKNNYQARTVTDDKGVTWYEVDIKPEYSGEVLAFKISEEKDAYSQKLKKLYNDTSSKVENAAKQIEKSRTEIEKTLVEKANTAKVVDNTQENVKKLSRFTNRRKKPVGALTERGMEMVDTLEFENPEQAQKEVIDYLTRKQRLIETRKQLQSIRRQIQNAKADTKEGKATLRDVERRLKLRRRLLEQKDFYVGMGMKRGAKEQMNMIRKRGKLLTNTQEMIGISDERAKKIVGGRRIHTMSEKEFDDFMQEFVGKAQEIRATLDARDEVKSIIQAEQFNKVDNLIKALGLPTIDKMTQEQASAFASVLYQYQFGDTFLTKRELETSIRTKYGEIRTERELLSKIEEITGIPKNELRAIEGKGSDIYKNWFQLSKKNPFYSWLVSQKMLAKTKELKQVYEFRTTLDSLVKKARASRKSGSVTESIWDSVAPTDKEVFQALDTGDFSQLTPEEKLLADFLTVMFRTKYEKLVENFSDFKGRENYVTHMARTFMETLRDTGSLKEAYTSYMNDQKEQENAIEILASQTGEVLAFDKFLPYMLRRSGQLVPSKNVSKIALTYFTATTRKELLDEFIPEAMLTLHGYKMLTGQTEKGLDLKPALEQFTKQYLNDAKGRKIEFITRQGSFSDTFLAALTGWISAKYIGGNPVLAFFNLFGDLLALSAGTTNVQKLQSLIRLFQSNNASEAIRGIVGQSPLTEIMGTQTGFVEKILPFWFSLMSSTSYLANQLTVRGMLTQEEFKTGIIEDKRIQEIAQQINKFKLTDSYGRSLVGNTTAGKASTQFKTWAVPFLITTIEHFSDLVKKFGESAKASYKEKQLVNNFTPQNKEQAIELARIVITGALMYATVQALKSAFEAGDEEDDYLWRQINNNLNTIYGILAMPFDKTNLVPVVVGEINKVQDLLKQLWTMETYKRPTKDNFTGDLKALETFKDIVTPVGATRIFNLKEEEGTPRERLIKESLQTGKFDAEEIAIKTSEDWASKSPESRQTMINNITQAHTAMVKYPDSVIVSIALGENNNKEKVASLVQYAKKVGVDQAYEEVKNIMKDRELYANQEKKTGALISAQLFRDFQVEVKKLKTNQ